MIKDIHIAGTISNSSMEILSKILKDGKEIFYIEYVSPHEPDIDEFIPIENWEITNVATLLVRKIRKLDSKQPGGPSKYGR